MSTVYALAAEAVVILHFGWIVFVVTGALVFRHCCPRLRFLHLLSVLYSLAIEVFVWTCPSTYLERWLWQQAGREADRVYEGAFIAHYLEKIIYWRAPQWLLVSLAAVLVGVTVLSYAIRPARKPAPKVSVEHR